MQRDAFGGTRPDAGQFAQGGGQGIDGFGQRHFLFLSSSSSLIYEEDDQDEDHEKFTSFPAGSNPP
jgi:hypothetical protein